VPSTDPGQQPQHYQIRIRGHLGESFRAAFPTLELRTEGHDTLLSGPLADQAALYGVLADIEALGLELVELRPSGAGADVGEGFRSDQEP